MVQVFQPFDLGGEVGKAVGQGFSDQAQRQIGASMVGSQLDALRDAYSQEGSNLNMFDLLKGITTAGILLPPEQAAAFQKTAPAIIQEIQRQKSGTGFDDRDLQRDAQTLVERELGGQQLQLDDAGISDADQLPTTQRSRMRFGDEGDFEYIKTLQDPAALQAELERDFVFSPREFDRQVQRRMTATGVTRPEAEQFVNAVQNRVNQQKQALVNQRIASVNREKEISDKSQTEIARVLGTVDQSGKTGLSISGEAQRAALNFGQRLGVENPNISPNQIADRVAENAKEYSRVNTLLESMEAPENFLYVGTPTLGIVGSADNFNKWGEQVGKLREPYEKFGLLEELREKMEAKGMTREFASYYAYPLSEDVSKAVDALPSLSNVEMATSPSKKLVNSYAKKLEPILEQLTPDDSLLSLKYELFRRGIPTEALTQAVDAQLAKDPDSLSVRMRNREYPELDVPMQPSLAEAWFNTTSPRKSEFLARWRTKGAKKQ